MYLTLFFEHQNNFLFDYGYITVLGALFKNKSIAKRFAKYISNKQPSTVYAHSNGNAIAVIAAKKYGAEIENLICIGAALRRDIKFPESIKNILVLSSQHDSATKSARFFNRIPLIRRFVPNVWGSMGTDNHIGDDPRVTKVYLDGYISDHSDYFTDGDLQKVERVIDDWLDALAKIA